MLTEKNENFNGIIYNKKFINPGIINSKDNNLRVGRNLLDFNSKKQEFRRKNSFKRNSSFKDLANKPKFGYDSTVFKKDFSLNKNNNFNQKVNNFKFYFKIFNAS